MPGISVGCADNIKTDFLALHNCLFGLNFESQTTNEMSVKYKIRDQQAGSIAARAIMPKARVSLRFNYFGPDSRRLVAGFLAMSITPP